PTRAAACIPQPADGFFPLRFVARSQVDVYYLGIISRLVSCNRALGIREVADLVPRSHSASLCTASRYGRVGAVSRRHVFIWAILSGSDERLGTRRRYRIPCGV